MSASGSRGVDTNNPTVSGNTRQYSQVVQTSLFPKREQGIILNVNDNLRLNDYVTAVGEITQPKNILFASKISNNRICIYLSNKQIVENLTNTYETIQIKGHNIGVRPLVTPAKRLILSNVSPCIPHEILENKVKTLGYKTASTMSFLRAGITDPAYHHVLSFRRQIYVLPNEDIELPSTIQIDHDTVTYRIFLTFDVLSCFLCKATGHIANQCPQHPCENTSPTETITSSATPTKEKDPQPPENINTSLIDLVNEEIPTITTENLQNQTQEQTDNRTKRPASPSTPSVSDQIPENLQFSQPPVSVFLKPKEHTDRRTAKKIKKSKSSENLSMEDILKLVEKHMKETTPPYILNFDQVTHLFENLPGSQDPIELTKTFSDDLPSVLNMLQNIYPHILHKGTKNRCTRLIKKITQHLNNIPISQEESDSDYSMSSQTSY